MREASFALPDGTVLAGDVEVHLRASDFVGHGHREDPAFGRVVLHLAWMDDRGEAAGGGQADKCTPTGPGLLSRAGQPCCSTGPVDRAVPPFVGLTTKTRHAPYSNPGLPGFLGAAHAPCQPDDEGLASMRLSGVTLDRLGDTVSRDEVIERLESDQPSGRDRSAMA